MVLLIPLLILFWYLCTFTEWGEKLLFLHTFQNIIKQTNKQINHVFHCLLYQCSGPWFFIIIIIFFIFQWMTFPSCMVPYHLSLLNFCEDVLKQEIFFTSPILHQCNSTLSCCLFMCLTEEGKVFQSLLIFFSCKSVFKQMKCWVGLPLTSCWWRSLLCCLIY